MLGIETMKKTFREYHQFTEEEYKQLMKDCIFVLDTNTLLDMYRYSRETANEYLAILGELKKKNQLWIPYQVGYEFYERRIDVISEYEKSYDEILSIIQRAKSDIETRYKHHPFLNFDEIKKGMNEGLSSVEVKIGKQKEKHPKWLDKDDVLESLNSLFESNIGENYSIDEIDKIKAEGKQRYEKGVPPGFKDNNKTEEKKYGDLILWYQIIDKAKVSKKPIVFISGDTKEDWWLKKDGSRLIPLPQLKKEILSKAGVDFHIYTPDRFLEFYPREFGKQKDITKEVIREVKKIREIGEERTKHSLRGVERRVPLRMGMEFHKEYIFIYELLQKLVFEVQDLEAYLKYKETIDAHMRRMEEFLRQFSHGVMDRMSAHFFRRDLEKIIFVFNQIIDLGVRGQDTSLRLREYVDRVEYLNQKLGRYVHDDF